MNSKQVNRLDSVGWLLALLAPLLAVYSFKSVPYPGSLIAAGVVIGGFIGYLFYEQAAVRQQVTRQALLEKLLLGVFIMALLVTLS